MKVATFNVNSVRSRLDLLRAWLEREQPDFLALQETKVVDALFPAAALESLGYHVCFRGQKSYNGVALLSRKAPVSVSYGFEDGTDDARLLCAQFDDVSVINTYVPQGRDIEHTMYAYKVDWFGRLRSWFDQRYTPSDPVIWLGDMNVAHDPIDVHNPEAREKHVCYHIDARKAFAACRDWGFVDVFRTHHPEPGHYTFYDYRNADNVKNRKGWRIDYILASAPLAEACTASYIDIEPRLLPKPSDHVPLVAEWHGF